MNTAIMTLKRQLLKSNTPEEFQRIKLEIERIQKGNSEVQTVPQPTPEVSVAEVEVEVPPVKDEPEVLAETEKEYHSGTLNDVSEVEEIQSDTPDFSNPVPIVARAGRRAAFLITNRVRVERLREYVNEYQEQLDPLILQRDELLVKEAEVAKAKNRAPRVLYDIDSKLYERIVKLERQIKGCDKMIENFSQNLSKV